jgi:hypothetical protein
MAGFVDGHTVERVRIRFQTEICCCGVLDLSRFCAAPRARLSHLPLKSDGAFPAQC